MEVNKGRGPQPSPLRAWVWKLYANTGMRRAEGLDLTWAMVGKKDIRILSRDDDPDEMEQRASGTSGATKSRNWRFVPLNDAAREALDELKQQTYETGMVIPQVDKNVLSRSFRKDIARAGLVGTLHWLRHTYVSHLVMNGVPLRTVQVLAGHSSYAVTERYAHLAPGYMHDTASRISL